MVSFHGMTVPAVHSAVLTSQLGERLGSRPPVDVIWHARDGISTYDTMPAFLEAVAEFEATGAKLNATYVYDKETGLKLFGKTAFYVHTPDGGYETFLRKPEADAFAAEIGGEVIDMPTAVAAFAATE
jgi:NitT/TauT family transport system substrate-binding protein